MEPIYPKEAAHSLQNPTGRMLDKYQLTTANSGWRLAGAGLVLAEYLQTSEGVMAECRPSYDWMPICLTGWSFTSNFSMTSSMFYARRPCNRHRTSSSWLLLGFKYEPSWTPEIAYMRYPRALRDLTTSGCRWRTCSPLPRVIREVETKHKWSIPNPPFLEHVGTFQRSWLGQSLSFPQHVNSYVRR